ncbi:MAG TPA: cytochrome c oxidase subunit II [Chloroflexia bacterium]|nr:cytochrome c oxidase subunit II [Chloroflexia bacterium]
MFDPISPFGKPISDLFIFILILGAFVFLLVFGIVVYAILSSRRRVRNGEEARQIFGNNRLEITWTLGATALVIFLFVLTVITMNTSDPAIVSADQQNPDVVIVGHQWWWEYQYPKAGKGADGRPLVTTANEMHMPVGTKFVAKLEAADVIHDFWVPQLGRKMDMIPGKNDNYLTLQSDKTGELLGACAEYCGAQHAWMTIHVIVQSQADFNNWLQSQKQPPAAPATTSSIGGNPARGQQIFLQNTCINCHAISGTTANANVAPNLTYLGRRKILGAGIIENTPRNLQDWILNPQSIKPGVKMPGYQFSAEDIKDLVAYLEEQK